MGTHPLAGALCAFAEAKGIELSSVEDPEHVYGCGMTGSVCGHHVVVGTADFARGKASAGSGSPGSREDNKVGALLEVHFSVGDSITGYASFEDPLREGSRAAVARLRNLGLKVSILSGDPSAHLDEVARLVGVDDARGGCLPQEKARLVHELASLGKVVMVGDEGNDAPALATAHVGISVGTRGLCSQSADVVV